MAEVSEASLLLTLCWRETDSNFQSLPGSVAHRAGGAARGNHIAHPNWVLSMAGLIVRIHLPPAVSLIRTDFRGRINVAREALSGHGIRRTVGIATVNALADYCWQRRPHPDVEMRHGVDAFDATDIRHGDKVVVVGAFVPFLKELKRRGHAFLVLEQDPATLKADELPFFRPAEQAAEILPDADVVLITGSTLVNNTLEHLLALTRPDARVTVVGPTVGMLPDAFLARGADVLGCVRITKPDAFLELLAEGGSGYHFFGRSAQKLVLARRPVRFDSRAA
jgi:uncharacterized protein